MSSEDTFYLMVGVVAVVLVLVALVFYAFKKLFGIDMRIELYAALAEYTGAWYDRKERREAASNRGRASIGHPPKRKN